MYSEGFNLNALHKAYETGILNKEDFSDDEHWAWAIEVFNSQTSEELEIPDLNNPNNELTDFSDIVQSPGADNPEDENEDFPVLGDENTRYFGHFQADYENFDWDNNYTETGFPDGQFLGNGLDAEGSAFLSECWRSHNTDGALDYIQMIADDELRERISRVYDLCDGSDLVDRSTVEFVWEQETLSDVCDDFYGLHS